MPHGSGVDVARHIRTVKADMPVIFITGYDNDYLAEDGAPVSHSAVLSKPAKIHTLSQMIRQLLD
ncbi:MAG: response regulator [Mariprofundus sp.]